MGATTVVDVFCHNCGHRNPTGVNFCSSCGTSLVTSAPDTSVSINPVDDLGDGRRRRQSVGLLELPRGVGLLVVKRGTDAVRGSRSESADHPAGRHPDSDIFLDDITVSRRHAEFVTDGPGHHGPRRRLAERDLRQPGAHRGGRAVQRRRGADREVQARVPGGDRRMTVRADLPVQLEGP